MTLETMVNIILKKIGQEQIPTVLATELSAMIVDWLNLRFQEVLSRHQWPFLQKLSSFGTTNGVLNYNLGNSVAEIEAIWYAASKKFLTEITYREWLRRNPVDPSGTNSNFTSAEPRLWCRAPGVDSTGNYHVYLYPIPDAIYTLQYEYFQLVNDMTADADEPGISNAGGARIWPKMWDNVLVEGALMDAYDHEGNEGKRAQQEVKWERIIMVMIARLGSSKTHKPLAIPSLTQAAPGVQTSIGAIA